MFPLNIVWYHQPAADRLISASLLTFPGTWKQNWESVWQRLREETAEVITWFHLSWFWFKKGRACHKRKKKEKNNNPTEKRSERTETHSERRDALNKKRWRQLITPHSNEIKWHREAMEERSARRNTNKKNYLLTVFSLLFCGFNQPRRHDSVSDTRQTRRRRADTERLMAPHATHAMLADYPRCLYSHMRSIWILTPPKTCVSPRPSVCHPATPRQQHTRN